MGTLGVFLLVLMRKDLSFKKLVKSFNESMRTAHKVFLSIYGSTVLDHFLAINEIPFLTDWVAGPPLHPVLTMLEPAGV